MLALTHLEKTFTIILIQKKYYLHHHLTTPFEKMQRTPTLLYKNVYL